MDKIIKVIDIDYDIIDNQIYFFKSFILGEFSYCKDDIDYDLIRDLILFHNHSIYKQMKMDKTYFLIEEPFEIIGVINLHRGWTFIDCADHSERCIIKSAYPEEICHVIGEDNE